jgi:hypothetical protein
LANPNPLEQLRPLLEEQIKGLTAYLTSQEEWLDKNEDSMEEADHESFVRQMERAESVLECLEEALEAIDDDEN